MDVYGKDLKDIILFGSYARGDNNDESDMNIMVLVDLDVFDEYLESFRVR